MWNFELKEFAGGVVGIQGQLYRQTLSTHNYQNSRIPERNQMLTINHIVCTVSLG